MFLCAVECELALVICQAFNLFNAHSVKLAPVKLSSSNSLNFESDLDHLLDKKVSLIFSHFHIYLFLRVLAKVCALQVLLFIIGPPFGRI